MNINKNIPKMEPMFSTEDRMKIIFTIIKLFKSGKHGPINFTQLYPLTNTELHTLHKVLLETQPPRATPIIRGGRPRYSDDIGLPRIVNINALDEDPFPF